MFEIADMIGGKRSIIPARKAEVKETLADISNTTRDLRWEPKVDIREKINEYIS